MTDPLIQFEARPGLLDLGWGHPMPGLLPVRAWARATGSALRTYAGQALTYGRDRGPGPLLDWLCTHLGDAAPEQTFVTAGASHALDLACAVLSRPGDVALVVSPTYHLAFRILTDRGLPDDSRRALADLGLTVVEDDTYRELAYDGPAPASLWRLSGGTAVVRLGSFAKTVAPGLRLTAELLASSPAATGRGRGPVARGDRRRPPQTVSTSGGTVARIGAGLDDHGIRCRRGPAGLWRALGTHGVISAIAARRKRRWGKVMMQAWNFVTETRRGRSGPPRRSSRATC